MPVIDPAIALSTRQDSLDRLRRAGPFNPPGDAGFAPDHDKTLMVSAEPPRSMKLVFGCRFGAACGVESLAGWVWWRRRRVSVVLSVM